MGDKLTQNVKPGNLGYAAQEINQEILKIHFKIGDEVKKNDVLFTLDVKNILRNIKRISAELDSAKLTFSHTVGQLTDLVYRLQSIYQHCLLVKPDISSTKNSPCKSRPPSLPGVLHTRFFIPNF